MDNGLTSGALAPPGVAPADSWQHELAQAIRSLDELWQVLSLPPELLPGAKAAAASFPLLVTRPFVARMRRAAIDDPLLRQVLPLAPENEVVPGFGRDPVGESLAHCQPGMLHKYRGRALLITTGSCAVHCRYCFRRHFPYNTRPRGRRWWEGALQTIAADQNIDEVILSGGDPLVLPDGELAALAADVAAIPQVQRLRLHTRLPIMIPQRVNDHLLAWLNQSRLQTVVVIHCNHAQEIDREVAAALGRLQRAGLPLLNQAVLLRGINDCPSAQYELGQALLAAGVIPYYLHALDPVAGAAHFAVSDGRAREIMDELHARAPGYLVPRLVREVAGEVGKRWLWPG